MPVNYDLSMEEGEGGDVFARATRRAPDYGNHHAAAPFAFRRELHDVPLLTATVEDFGFLRTKVNAIHAAWKSGVRLALRFAATRQISLPMIPKAAVWSASLLAIFGAGVLVGVNL